jgi:hypothetical protein
MVKPFMRPGNIIEASPPRRSQQRTLRARVFDSGVGKSKGVPFSMMIAFRMKMRDEFGQGSCHAKVFKKYSQMKRQMKREALARLNRQAGELPERVLIR